MTDSTDVLFNLPAERSNMDVAEAEAKLDDYLMKGIVSEIFRADECKAFAVKIGQHSIAINASEYAHLFGRLQTTMSEHQTLAVAKIYDSDKRTRSIPSVVSLIEANAGGWQLRDRRVLENMLVNEGRDQENVRELTDEQLILLVVERTRTIYSWEPSHSSGAGMTGRSFQ
jgi:hypothetical protein